MGVVADISGSTVEFLDPDNPNDVFNVIDNSCRLVMHSFRIAFGIDFDAKPGRGVEAGSSSPELWRIGIVQNVIFELIRFKYSDGVKFEVEWSHPALDSVAHSYKGGFYADPLRVPACRVNPQLKCTESLPVMTPVSDIILSKGGYGQLMAPSGEPETSSGPKELDMLDRPAFGARFRRNRASLILAEHIAAFQTWLVATKGGKVEPLAHTDQFSLLLSLTADPLPKDALSIESPPFVFNFWGQKGIARSTKTPAANLPEIKISAGRGGKATPLMTGQTANTRGNGWLQTSGLIP